MKPLEQITPSGSSHWPSSLDIKIVKRFLRSSQENGQHYQKSARESHISVLVLNTCCNDLIVLISHYNYLFIHLPILLTSHIRKMC